MAGNTTPQVPCKKHDPQVNASELKGAVKVALGLVWFGWHPSLSHWVHVEQSICRPAVTEQLPFAMEVASRKVVRIETGQALAKNQHAADTKVTDIS